MLVSVFMIAYNHEKYIRQAIEGILMQQVNFKLELVIGEDYSTDNTRAICEEYVIKYPNLVRLLSSDRKYGIHQNVVRTFEACTGKYIAVCEGDDYWTSSSKLQKQVDFLENNPDFAICFHDVEVVYESVKKKSFFMNQDRSGRDVFAFGDVVKRGFEIATCSCVFRNFNEPIPMEIFKQDWPILLYYSFHGSIKYLDEAMGVYRRHEGGFTHIYSSAKALYLVDLIQACRKYFAPNNIKDFYVIEARYYADICFNYYREGDYAKFAEYYSKISIYSGSLEPATKRALRFRHIMSKAPLLAKSFSRVAEKKQRFFYLFKKKA